MREICDDAELAALCGAALDDREDLGQHYPGSYAKPGIAGVRRWAGIRDDAGALVAVGADAWSAPTVGLVGGITVRPAARSRGSGRRTVDGRRTIRTATAGVTPGRWLRTVRRTSSRG